MVKGLFDTDFKFSLFGKGTVAASRRALKSSFSEINYPIMACYGRC